jgi:hypothetical protein
MEERIEAQAAGIEAPAAAQTRNLPAVISYHSMSLAEKARTGASISIPSIIVFEVFGGGALGAGLAICLGLAGGYWSEELPDWIRWLPAPRQIKTRQGKLHWWLTGEQLPATPATPDADPATEGTGDTLEVDTGQDNGTGDSDGQDIDALFQKAPEEQGGTAIARLMPNDIIRHTEPDNYRICIGRSLTKPGNPPVWINFYGQHLKLIGASQYGKSSIAACILYLITRTHAPENILIALLDMEHKTSKLFADCQHIAAVQINGEWVTLHAKTREQVLEHLNHIVAIVDERYLLSEAEVEQEPILLVYLEEFLALKDYYKRQIDRTAGSAREQAKDDYARLVFSVSEIARRGLKVKVQYLLCAQVDYRDDDFREALVNITGGMSFCVDSNAARAAGFVRNDLLKRNVEDDKKGQAVTETPDCKDLVLAPEYNLKKKLLDFERERHGQNPARPKRSSILGRRGSRQDGDGLEQRGSLQESIRQNTPPAPTPDNQRKLTTLHRQALEHYQPGIGYRQLGELIGVGKDKAGDLLKDLRKWGYITDDETNE